mmetsp:Transcript_85665/g.154221  ORF Transcript_85665/g.154221 Transcript_85665/m.154221 type:complete len:352 (+) Transcript_85665:274-1329(+)|eukprot:CAMPEP_0115059140 /NCGR_PEP_ID=MMETSP0227-20121206/6743_1 /TAXON_ID=89957 /ORGANISM="Polarella glacialis, Strain CCMP 1383" /LENGTH=351 /DNA_ID=CAMNT_0002444211 /DNA_START=274 /DNA_END=1329 /DNA_ORIENTATION=-
MRGIATSLPARGVPALSPPSIKASGSQSRSGQSWIRQAGDARGASPVFSLASSAVWTLSALVLGAASRRGSSTRRLRPRRRSGPPDTQEQRLRELEESFMGSEVDEEDSADPLRLETVAPGSPRFADVQRLPRFLFLPRPGYRTFAANVAGDNGFDPLGLCKDVPTFVNYREAELKHGRLAMLAALAWPLVELYDEELVDDGLPDLLAATGGRVLPQLTGAPEDQFVEIFATIVLLIGGIFELVSTKGVEPGDRGFDPLGVKGFTAPAFLQGQLTENRPWMGEAEVQHSRLAMLAILYFYLDELFTGNPVLEDTESIIHRLDANIFRLQYWTLQPEILDISEIIGTQNTVL